MTTSRHASPPTRILLVDDHVFTSLGAKNFLDRQPGLAVVAAASTPREALAAIDTHEVDVAIVDLVLGSEDGLELVKRIASLHPGLRILVMSMLDETLYAGRALRSGALGYVMKGDDPDVLLSAIATVGRGDVHVSERARATLVPSGRSDERVATPEEILSDRELTVFRWLGEGLTAREIAEALHLSPKTVHTYRERIKVKLGLSSGNELIHRAVHFARAPQGRSARG